MVSPCFDSLRGEFKALREGGDAFVFLLAFYIPKKKIDTKEARIKRQRGQI